MNVELLQRVKAHILEDPRRVHMGCWIENDSSYPCGTIGCIALWIVLLGRSDFIGHELYPGFQIQEPAIALLNPPTEEGVTRLVYTLEWPQDLLERLRSTTPQTPEYAAIVAERIDHFIATDGAE